MHGEVGESQACHQMHCRCAAKPAAMCPASDLLIGANLRFAQSRCRARHAATAAPCHVTRRRPKWAQSARPPLRTHTCHRRTCRVLLEWAEVASTHVLLRVRRANRSTPGSRGRRRTRSSRRTARSLETPHTKSTASKCTPSVWMSHTAHTTRWEDPSCVEAVGSHRFFRMGAHKVA